jgi:hypothetical protein
MAATGDHGREAGRLADVFCRQSRVRVEELFTRLWTNTDGPDRHLARAVLSGRMEWLEAGIVDPSREGPWIADATPGPSTADNVRRRIG